MLSSKGWINDQRSAESFAASRKRMGWGPAKIRAAFFKRGIAGSLAEKALAAEFGGQEEANSAIGLLRSQRRRFRRSGRALSSKGQEKALAFLLRRGFSYVSSHLAVQKVLGYNSDLPEED
jgi:SOS response regulatory protein OraA/RecX